MKGHDAYNFQPYGSFTNYIGKSLPIIDHLPNTYNDISEGIPFSEIRKIFHFQYRKASLYAIIVFWKNVA